MAHGKPTLYYFDGRGLAELVRLTFGAGGMEFNDVRFASDSNASAGNSSEFKWPEFKAHTVYGQVPLLVVGETKIAQSNAIVRYVAREVGLLGRTSLETALIDATHEQLRDLADGFKKWRGVPEAEQAAFKTKYISELNEKTTALEAQLAKNGGFFVNGLFSLADVVFYSIFVDVFELNDAAAFAAHCPQVFKDHIKKVAAQPHLAAYLAKRPASKW